MAQTITINLETLATIIGAISLAIWRALPLLQKIKKTDTGTQRKVFFDLVATMQADLLAKDERIEELESENADLKRRLDRYEQD